MNVKEFITQHPRATLDMMTPGGYVYLTPEKAKALLEGKSTFGHPGDPEYAMEIPAEELLSQHIHSANYSKGVWHMLTDCTQGEQEDIKLDKDEIVERLREKLDSNMDTFQKEWWQKSPSVLVGIAKEIAATQTVYNELYGGGYPSEQLEYLLRFENPLEVVRDQWILEQNLPLDEEMSHALWYIADKQDAEQDYALDESYKPPGMVQGVTMC